MADLAVTATAVLAGATGTTIYTGTLGAAVIAGQAVYVDPADGLVKLAQSNGGASVTADPRKPGTNNGGIALNGGAVGQPVRILQSGPLTMNAVLTAGVMYYLSATPGGICPVADLSAGRNAVALGFASSPTVLNVRINESGVQL